MSLYQDITDKLVEELDHGKFEQGQRFYSEADICERFGVSSTTAVKVLNALQESNRVTRIQGRGTFVASENHRSVVMYTDLNMSNTETEHVKVLSVERKSDPALIKLFNLTEDDTYYEIVRLRYIGTQVSQYSVNYINAKYLPSNVDEDMKHIESVYQLIRETSDIDPYVLPFAQKNTAVQVKNTAAKSVFSPDQTVIKQQRKTFLPNASHELLEYALSYKLPTFWGFQTNSVFGVPDDLEFPE